MTTTQTQLRQIFRTMDPHKAQEIREAYYKAVEGLMTLAEALEIADAEHADSPTVLIDEHLLAVEALDAINKCKLGAVL